MTSEGSAVDSVQPPRKKLAVKVGAIDVRDIAKDLARDAGDAAITASKEATRGPRLFHGEGRTSKEQLAGFGNMLKNIWKHNLGREYYRQKEISLAKERIFTGGDIYANEQGQTDRSAHVAAMQAVTKRFISEYDTISNEGEFKKTLADSPTELAFKKELQDLVLANADPRTALDEENFEEASTRIIDKYSDKIASEKLDAEDRRLAEEERNLAARQGIISEDVYKSEAKKLKEERSKYAKDRKQATNDIARKEASNEKLYATNILEVAKQVRQAVEHGTALEQLDLDLDIVIGRAKSSLRTEPQLKAVDKITEKIMNSKLGRVFFNETTAAAAVSLAWSLGSVAARSTLTSKIAAFGTFGITALMSGGIAGLKERVRLEEERSHHQRDLAKGKKLNLDNSPRRQEMQETVYDMDAAKDLISGLDSIYNIKADGSRELKDLTPEEYQAAIGRIADIEARNQISAARKIDLISYSDVRKVEQERFQLDETTWQAKADLRKMAGAIPGGKSFDEFLSELVQARSINLVRGENGVGGVEAKDKIFNKMQTSKAWKKALWGTANGLLVGATLQEGAAFLKSGQTGMFEHWIKGGNENAAHVTPLEGFRRWWVGAPPQGINPGVHDIPFGNGHLKVPAGMNVVPLPGHHSFRLMEGNNVIADNVPLDGHGAITQSGRALLESQGIHTTFHLDHISTIANKTTVIPGTPGVPGGNAQDFIHNHQNIFGRIRRGIWGDNDTPAPKFDKNELGIDDPIRDSQGNILIGLKRMTPDGSYHNNWSADAIALAKAHKLQYSISLSENTQNMVSGFEVNEHMQVVIPANSDMAKAVFKQFKDLTPSEHAWITNNFPHHHFKPDEDVFTARFGEVQQEMQIDPDGVRRMATLATQEGPGLSGIPGTPDTAITEAIKTIKEVPINTLDQLKDYRIDMPWMLPLIGRKPLEPAELRKNSDRAMGYYGYGAGGEDLGLLSRDQYRQRMSRRLVENPEIDLVSNDSVFVEEYLEKQDKAYLEELDELVAEAEPMNPDVEVVITVPAYQEGQNMEKTLRRYAQMKDRNKFELVILENHPKGKPRDNTKEAIDKIKREFPDLNIVHLYKVFDKKPAIGNVRKYLVDSVLLRKNKAGIDKSIAIVSNDADLEGISENYVRDIARSFASNPRLDAVGGKWDFQEETFKQFPLLHASQRLWHYFDIAFRYNYIKSPDLIGRNSAFRSGAYAAIGGYNEKATLAEDLEIGWLIKDARRYDASRIKFMNSAWIISNPRRAVNQLLSDGRLVNQYGDFHVNEEVRKAPIAELLKDKRDFDENGFKKEVAAIYDFYAKIKKSNGGWCEDEYVEKSFDRAMRFLGVSYEKNGGTVVVKDISKLRQGLDSYAGLRSNQEPENEESNVPSEQEEINQPENPSEPEQNTDQEPAIQQPEPAEEPEPQPELEQPSAPETNPEPEIEDVEERIPNPDLKRWAYNFQVAYERTSAHRGLASQRTYSNLFKSFHDISVRMAGVQGELNADQLKALRDSYLKVKEYAFTHGAKTGFEAVDAYREVESRLNQNP